MQQNPLLAAEEISRLRMEPEIWYLICKIPPLKPILSR